MVSALTSWSGRAASRWLFQPGEREPGEVYLHRRRVFILPTKAGLGFAGLLLVLLIGATNYNLGLGFGLTFLLAACGLVDMVLTSRNLAKLQIIEAFEVQIIRPELIPGDLFLNKTVVRLVVIKGLDHIVPVTPRIRVVDISFKTRAVGVPGNI